MVLQTNTVGIPTLARMFYFWRGIFWTLGGKMRFIVAVSALLIAAPVFGKGAVVETIVLDECYKDSPLDGEAIQEHHAFGGNGFKWFYARYTHSYLLRQKLLVVGVAKSGEVYEREVTSSLPKTKSFSSRADYYEQHVANNFPVQRQRVEEQVSDFIRSRLSFQCP